MSDRRPGGRSGPRVLMVTGAYMPELSGGGLQCKAIVDTLHDEATFVVLTTSTDQSLRTDDSIDGTRVHRVFVQVSSRWSRLRASWKLTRAFLQLASQCDVVHLHGFSQKSILVVALATLFRKPIVLTLHTAGQDEPDCVHRRGWLAAWAYARVNLYLAVSAPLAESLVQHGVPPDRVCRVSNGLDTCRFRPPTAGEAAREREALGLPLDRVLILFVGFFSADKGPHVLFEAWRKIAKGAGAASSLVYVGATKSQYHEVDESLAVRIREGAEQAGLGGRIVFVGETRRIERYYRAVDVFVFPTRREAFGMALVEAMASGLVCIASRIAQVTDDIVTDGETGLLVEPQDTDALAEALERALVEPALAARLSQAARASVVSRFAIEQTARLTLEAYRRVWS